MSQTERRSWLPLALEVVAIVGLTLLVRLLRFDHAPEVDEMHHLLAARSWVQDGTLQIGGGGEYTRVRLFTYLIAGLFQAFGESLTLARVPALVAGVGLVVAVFLWVRRVASPGAAWAAALLLCLYPNAIRLSQITRFYTLQALCFWLGAIGWYALLAPGRTRSGRTVALAVGTAAVLLLGLHFQILTAVGIAGLVAWTLLDAGPRVVRAIGASPRRGLIWAGLGVGLVVLAGAAYATGWLHKVWALYRYADSWAESERYNVRFYHWQFLGEYATLWTLFPFAVLAAALRYRRAALMCGVVFAVAFLFQSTAAWKHHQYIFYAMPMLFAVSGMAIAIGLAAARDGLASLLAPALGDRPRLVRSAVLALLVGASLFTIIGNGAASNVVRMVTGSADRESETADGRWGLALDSLRALTAEADAVVTSSPLKTLWYLQRVDYSLLDDYLVTDRGRAEEFTRSHLFDRPMLSSAGALDRVTRCYAHGLVLVENGYWRRDWGVPPATADWLEAQTERVDLPPDWRIMAFRWSRAPSGPVEACRAGLVPAAATGGG